MCHFKILIIGGGTAGITVAAQLKRKGKSISIGLIEPSENHFYQPAWTLVGAGAFDFEKTKRKEADFIPKGVEWIKDYATGFDPENNAVLTKNSGSITYDYLVVAPGLVMNFDLLPGLKEAMETDSVGSVYTDPQKFWKILQNFKGGNAVFTQPTTPIKCGGAPQKIMYLSEHFFRKRGIRKDTNVIFATPGTVIFGVKEIAETLTKIIQSRDIYFKPFYAPVKIDGQKKEITFKFIKPDTENIESVIDPKLSESVSCDTEITIKYDLLHLAPPQEAPEFIKNSSLVYQEGPNKGWLEVDINTLQHLKYPNIFGLGDVVGLPTAKTGAAVRKQAPVVVGNILELIKRQKIGTKIYEGYSSCPLVTGYGKMVLAEFKYNNIRDSHPLISKFVDTTKEQFSMWLLKKYGLPFIYWNLMLRGKA